MAKKIANAPLRNQLKGHSVAKKNWIQEAIKKPGSLREELHIKKGKKIPKEKLEKASEKPGIEGKRANLAITLSKLRKKKGK